MAKNDKTEVSEEYSLIPLDKIHVDSAWNARSMWEQADSDFEQSNSLQDLTTSIKEKGQETPCEVVPYPGKKGEFSLFTGFRRHAAVSALKIPTLKCIIRNLTPAEMRRRNMTENTERAELRAADTNWAIGQYISELGSVPTQEVLAQTIGLSQSYVSKHLQCLEKVKPEVLTAWREGLPVNRKEGVRQDVGLKKFMAVAQVDQDRQAEQWHLLLGINEAGEPVKASKDPVEKAKAEAKRIGMLLGRLVAAEVITVDGDFAADLALFVESASELKTRAEKESVAGMLSLAFTTAKTGEESKEDKEENAKKAAQ